LPDTTTAPRTPIVRLLSPLRDFLHTESAGGTLVAAGALAALVWANSPWSDSYHRLWESRLAISAAGHTLDLDLRHWLNDGLMAIFFLVVGLEIKRELTHGHLASRRAATLPLVAALGGMLAPALIYLAIAGTTAPRGWAIPMATDIALAIGVLAVLGPRIPTSLRVFLLGLAIVDDIGAIAVIAAFYSSGIGWGWLAAAAAALVVVPGMRRFGVYNTGVYIVVGVFVWFCLHEGGIHPTLAGVAMGLLAPATPRLTEELVDVDALLDVSNPGHVQMTTQLARGSVSVVEWLQHVVHPWTSYLIVPIFALANAGIEISRDGLRAASTSAITWGIVAGLVLGKPLGIIVATRLAVRGRIADAPTDGTSRQVLGIGAAAGIGFTVALFITELAFDDPLDQQHAKLAILLASFIAALLAVALLGLGKARGQRQPAATITSTTTPSTHL
jgi:NhaA family Na+:H+ antiporter